MCTQKLLLRVRKNPNQNPTINECGGNECRTKRLNNIQTPQKSSPYEGKQNTTFAVGGLTITREREQKFKEACV